MMTSISYQIRNLLQKGREHFILYLQIFSKGNFLLSIFDYTLIRDFTIKKLQIFNLNTLFSFITIPLFNNCVKHFQHGIVPIIPLLLSQSSTNLLFAKVVVLYKNKLLGRNGTSIKGNKISSRVQK
jgi:hypothetical protein